MATDFFFLTEQIVSGKKYFPCSQYDLLIALQDKGYIELETEHHVRDDFANLIAVVLRLNITCKNDYREGWTVAMKLHNARIDGIDWEPKFHDPDGVLHSGWHRHMWDRKKRSAERTKVRVTDLQIIKSREHFLTIVFSLMGIVLDANDYGTTPHLPLT
jgi:hypothetical protein